MMFRVPLLVLLEHGVFLCRLTMTIQKIQCPIRSYVCRSGRMSRAQQRVLARHGSDYVIKKTDQLINFNAIFKHSAPLIIEIGFGMGDNLAMMAKTHGQYNYLGIEVYPAGIASLLGKLADHQANDTTAASNVRIFPYDAVEVLRHNVVDHSIQEIWILFPDPWPKRRHHKRRLIQSEFMALLAKKLVKHGIVYIATDHADYANHISTTLKNCNQFALLSSRKKMIDNCTSSVLEQEQYSHTSLLAGHRSVTKYEHFGQRLGHTISDMCFIRV